MRPKDKRAINAGSNEDIAKAWTGLFAQKERMVLITRSRSAQHGMLNLNLQNKEVSP